MKSLFIIFLYTFPLTMLGQEFTNIVAFGDSFTDNGHVDNHGFNRDCNGKVWVEYLGDILDTENIDNRAWGGARTDYGHYTGFNWSGFNWQIDNYSYEGDSDKTLYTIWIGINDYWDTIGSPIIAVENIKQGIVKLANMGAKYFLIFNNFDLTISPGYGPDSDYHDLIPKVQELVNTFNQELYKMLYEDKVGLTKTIDMKVFYIDIYSFMNKLLKNKEYENVDIPWKGSYQDPRAQKYLWYDEWHPMTSCHYKIAELATDVLTTN